MLRTVGVLAAAIALLPLGAASALADNTSGVAQASGPPAFPWQCWRTGEGPYPSAQGGCIPAVSAVPNPSLAAWVPNTASETRTRCRLEPGTASRVACSDGESLIECPAPKVAAAPEASARIRDAFWLRAR